MSKYVADANEQRWTEDIVSDGLLLQVARDLEKFAHKKTIGVAGLDALVSALANARGTSLTAARFSEIANLLIPDLRSTLGNRLWSAILALPNPQDREAARGLASLLLLDTQALDIEPIASGVIMPILASPEVNSASWLEDFVKANRPKFENHIILVAELRARLALALRPSSGVSTATKKTLRRISKELPKGPARRARRDAS